MLTAASAAVLAGGAAYANGHLRLSSDLRESLRLKLGERNLKRALASQTSPCFELFKHNALKHPSEEAVWTRQRSYSWHETLDIVCKYATFFRAQNVQAGDVVGFYLMNSAEFMFAWMGLLALGALPANINYNLEKIALLRCLDVAEAKIIVIDADSECQSRVLSAQDELDQRHVRCLILDDKLIASIERFSSEMPQPPAKCSMSIAIMYTSGSTGLPKAMLVGVQRAYCTASVWFKTFGQVPGQDRCYYCIPLYHGTGGIAAMVDLMGGMSIALAPKFSVSGFWVDCISSKSTVALYVGEILRYLLAAPPSPNDQANSLRLIWGNGLRPDIWARFQERFKVTEVGEFFASTEGMLTLVNHSRNDFSRGAVGQQGWYSRLKSGKTYVSVRVDVSGDITRDPATGFAEQTPLSEGGEILIRVADRSSWRGYLHAVEATSRKFATDVFAKGDVFYRTGDALRRSPQGLWYFLDRLGDTYRWKGENVSTAEVAEVLGQHPIVAEANVYGVVVPGHEGKAGCVALRLNVGVASSSSEWMHALASHLRSNLPRYAVPVFVRLIAGSRESMTTGNHKQLKGPLQQEGIDPSLKGSKVTEGAKDQFFWLPVSGQGFEPYDDKIWSGLQIGQVKL